MLIHNLKLSFKVKGRMIVDDILKTFIDQFSGAVNIVNSNKEISIFNKKFCEYFQLSVDELKGKKVFDIFPECEEEYSPITYALESGKPISNYKYFNRGKYKFGYVCCNIPTILNDGQYGVVSLGFKSNKSLGLMTCQTKKEYVLETIKKRFIDSDTLMVSVVDKEGKILNINSIALKQFNLKKNEVLGKSMTKVLHNKLGKNIKPLELNVMKEKEMIHTQKLFEFEKKKKYFDMIALPIIVEQEVIGAICLSIDNTEKMRLNKYLERSEKIKNAGEMAFRIIHEIRNPLQLVKASAQLGKNTIENKEINLSKLEQYYHKIDQGIEEVMNVLDEVLKLSKMEKPNLKVVKMNDLLTEVKDLIAYYCVENNIRLKVNIEQELKGLNLELDPKLIKEAILNVIQNAIEQLEVCRVQKMQSNEIDAGQADVCCKGCQCEITIRSWINQRNLYITINNNGPVISREIRETLFDVFTSTKGQNGTGLGLSIVHHIIHHLHHGKVWFNSNFEEGTTFYFELPLQKKESAQLYSSLIDKGLYYKRDKQINCMT